MRCTFKRITKLTSFILLGYVITGTFYSVLLVPEQRVLYKSNQSDKDFQKIDLRFQQESADQRRNSTPCSKHGRGLPRHTSILSRATLQHVIVSNRYQTLFCYVPKVACSNWKGIFHVLEGHFNTTEEIDSTFSHESGLLRFLQDYPHKDVHHMLKTYKKIVFVREPMERVLSAYRNKFVRSDHRKEYHDRYGLQIIRKYRENFTGEVTDEHYTTFSEFVKYVIDLRPLDKHDEHWDLQYNLCSPCDINYDFIGKFDILKSDAALALQLMGADKVVTFPDMGTKPAGEETKTKMKTFFSQISKEEFMLLEKTYEKDYEVFGFDKPSYLGVTDR